MKSYWMLQNAKFTAFTISELSRVNQQRGKITPTQIKVKIKEQEMTDYMWI